MAARVTANYKNSNVKQDVLLIEADTTLVTKTGDTLQVAPSNSTGKIQVFAVGSNITGAGATKTVKVQHSPNGVDWFDVAGQTPFAVAVGTPIGSVVGAGPTMRYVRAVATASGTVTTFTLNVYAYVSAN